MGKPITTDHINQLAIELVFDDSEKLITARTGSHEEILCNLLWRLAAIAEADNSVTTCDNLVTTKK